jgi:hypothetical protein
MESKPALPEFVEVHAAPHDARFELELGAGPRIVTAAWTPSVMPTLSQAEVVHAEAVHG